jgi:tetratricopeptide (TPR) repeat protein
VLYLPALRGEFTNYDDDVYVTRNVDVVRPDLRRILDPRHHTASDWTPAVTFTHILEHRLFGWAPLPYHATNVVLHAATTGVVYALLRTVGVAVLPALLSALVFAVHPLQVENVAWVSSRKTLLAGLFGLGSFLLFLRGRPGLATASFLLAAMSKGTVVVIPLFILAALLLGFGSRRPTRRDLGWLVGLGLLAAARGLGSALAQSDVVARTATADLLERLALMGPILATQFRQLALPYDLAPVYPWPTYDAADARVLLGWTFVLFVIGAVALVARRDRHVALFGAVGGLALLPTLNLWPAPFLQADRYLHLALIGGGFLFVRAFAPLARIRTDVPAVAAVVWCAFVFVPVTLAQTRVWQTSETLWTAVVERSPGFADAHANLGEHYLQNGQADRARDELERALALRPQHGAALYNLALLEQERAPDRAEHSLRLLLAVEPDAAQARGLLGQILARRGENDAALHELDRALELDPTLAPARWVRARIHARTSRFGEAGSDFEILIASGNGTPEVLNELAAVRLAEGHPDRAAVLAVAATDANPKLAVAWDTLAAALLELGDLDGASRAIDRGVEANRDLADLYYRRARMLELRRDLPGARTQASLALEKLGPEPRDWRNDARRLSR